MKAQRATTELGLLGCWYLVAGIVAVVRAAEHGRPDFGPLSALFAVLVLGGSIGAIAMAVARLREIEGLPPTARRISPLLVSARVSLVSVVGVVALFFASNASSDAGWILGAASAVLGAAVWAIAALATHVEHLCGARVWRANHRFYWAR